MWRDTHWAVSDLDGKAHEPPLERSMASLALMAEINSGAPVSCLVIAAHCLNCLVVQRLVGRQDVEQFGHACAGVSEPTRAGCRLPATGSL